jgi:hypothetical protein
VLAATAPSILLSYLLKLFGRLINFLRTLSPVRWRTQRLARTHGKLACGTAIVKYDLHLLVVLYWLVQKVSIFRVSLKCNAILEIS